MLVGCDASKAELDSTKSTLTSVTHERDDLKAQVATLQQQLTSTQGDLAKEKAADAADKTTKSTMAAKTTTVGSPTASKHKTAHKS